MEKEDFTLKDFENRFRVESNPVQQNVFYFWDEIIGEMISAGRTGNARANKDTFNSLNLFHKTLQRYNKDLKEIAQICGIDKPLSSYVARHSFANCLKQKGVATDVISESMGHQNLAITQAYLKELDSTVLDEASELLL